MKRCFAVIAALVMLMSLLAACGDSDGSSVPNTAPAASDADRLNDMIDYFASLTETSPVSTEEPYAEPDRSLDDKTVDLEKLADTIVTLYYPGELRMISDPGRYYGIRQDDVVQFCAYKPVQSSKYDEIVLCEASSEEAASRIETMLVKHLDSLLNTASSYDKDALSIVSRSDVVTNGKYVYLVISPDYDKICKMIESAL